MYYNLNQGEKMYVGNVYKHKISKINGTVVDEDINEGIVLIKTESGTELFIYDNDLENDWELIGNKRVKSTLPTKASKVNNSKKVNLSIDRLLDYIFDVVKNMGGEIYVPENSKIKMRMFKVNNHLFMKCSYSHKSVKLYCRSKAVKDIYKPTMTANHMFDYVYVFTSNEPANHKIVNYLIKLSMDYQVHKDKSHRT